MGGHFTSFRDPHLSRWLSIVDELVLRREAAAGSVRLPGAPEPGAPRANAPVARDVGHPAREAAVAAAADVFVASSRQAMPDAPPGREMAAPTPGPAPALKECAHRALRLLAAHIERSEEDVQRLKDELADSECDPLWLTAMEEYVKRFGIEHMRVPYRPAPANPAELSPLTLPENATIALLADWGTGTHEAFCVLAQIAEMKPDVVIHLGDIYYSGTQHETQNFLAACNHGLGRDEGRAIPVFTLAGNHDMYSGGQPYYALIDALNQPPLAPAGQLQRGSFFGLRSSGWQLLAMDTGLNDHDALKEGIALTRLENLEAAWHRHWIERAEGRRTILLSHHPLFSAFSPVGKAHEGELAVNTELLGQLGDRLDDVDAWFWGHEHNLALYGPHLRLKRGRLIGHGAIPVFVSQEPYASRVGDAIPVLPPKLDQRDGVYHHGFVILKLDDASRTATASYYQNCDERQLIYSETIGGD